MSVAAPTERLKDYVCTGCGATKAARRCPPKWKQMPAGPLCGECRGGYATRVVTLSVAEVMEPAATRLLDSMREAWRLSTDLANWCQSELLRRDVRRTPTMERLPAYSVGSLYTIWRSECPFADAFGGCAGSAAAIIRECEQRWKGHPSFGRFAVLWRGESSSATYRYPYPWIVRAQEAKLDRREGVYELSVTVPGGRNLYRLDSHPSRNRQLRQLAAILDAESKMGDVKLCARWSGGRIVGVDARFAVTQRIAAKVTGQTAIVRTGNDALLLVELPDRSEPFVINADNLRGVLAAYERWRYRASVDLKHEKRWPSHVRQRIRDGQQDRIQRHHARLKTGIEQLVSIAVKYALRHGCGTIVYDDSDRGAIPGNFPWRQMRERMSLTASNHGMEFQTLTGEGDADE